MSDASQGKIVKTFTAVYQFVHPTAGNVVVCVEGKHAFDGTEMLEHPFVVLTQQSDDGEYCILEDPDITQAAINLITSVCYMEHGTVVTSDTQPVCHMIDGVPYWLIELKDYGTVSMQNAGVIESDGDYFQISVSHPSDGVYLVILLQIIDVDPLEFRAIDLGDEELRTGIIGAYMVEIGAATYNEDDGGDAEDDLPDYS
jgi:hypothetical protein